MRRVRHPKLATKVGYHPGIQQTCLRGSTGSGVSSEADIVRDARAEGMLPLTFVEAGWDDF